jgi:hypothetical protein
MFVSAPSGHSTFCRPIVANPTIAPRIIAIQHRVTFSLQACLLCFSFIPNILNKAGGAHHVVE